jgi:hypothetical protein
MANDTTTILSTPVVSVADDLAQAKRDGIKLPGLLNDLATFAHDAKSKGADFVVEDIKIQVKEHLPWILVIVLSLTLLAFCIRYKVIS